jgi:hypothetical protein
MRFKKKCKPTTEAAVRRKLSTVGRNIPIPSMDNLTVSYMTLAQRSQGGKSTTTEGCSCGATLKDHSAQCVFHLRLALMRVSIWIKKLSPGYFYALPE